MKIFQNKIPKTWKSTGVTINNGQMEMSNFSFAEEYFISTSNKFTINIVGKNIIGNGIVSLLIYKDTFLVWKEEILFKNNSFSKNIIEIEEEANKTFRIVLSRGKSSKGKLLINSVSISQLEKNINAEPEPVDEIIQPEDEPIFSSYVEDKIEEVQAPVVEKKKRKAKEPKIKEEVEIKKKKKSSPKPKLSKKNATKDLAENNPTISESHQEVDAPQVEVTKPKKNNIWVHIIDFSTISDERDFFKYVNQISFGKGRQTFLIKKNNDIQFNLPAYDHVSLFDQDYDIENKLIELNPNKITFLEENLNKDLLEIIKNILDKQ
jgi:hypothetical protein